MTQVVSSISGLEIYSPSAGFAPTNSGDVSAIASGYQVVSATATQLYAGTAFLTEVNGAPVSASRAGQAANASMANSAYYDGTGRLISALPDSAAVSSIASSYAESAASGKLDSTAEVVTATAGDGTYVTSINGLGISGQGGGGGVSVLTASARTMYSAADGSAVTGFSGINGVGPVVLRSGTVVAGAMRMQFGNSSTNQYTGTVYQSSVDGDANYRWATGNIILMSSTMGYGYYKGHQLWLCRGPYSASHRISFDVNNTTADVMVYKNGNSAVITPSGFAIWGPTTAAADRRNIDSAAVDRWNSYSALPDSAAVSSIASSYAESAASGKLDTTAFNSADFYTTANESGYVGSAYVDSAVSGKLDTTAQVVTATAGDGTYITSINGLGISGQGGGGATGDYVDKSAEEVTIGSSNTSTNMAFAQGVVNSASGSSLAQGYGNTADSQSLAQGYRNTAKFDSMAQGFQCTATYTGFAQGVSNSAYYYSVAQGNANSAAQYSFAQGSHNTARYNSFAQGAYNSAKNTAVVFGTYNLSGDGSTSTGNSAAFAIGDGTASTARHDLMLVTKNGEITMYSSTADTVGTGIMSAIRAISAAATGGGVDSATVSSIASSYAKSAASSKLDTTAQVVTATGSASVGSWGWNTAMVSSINGSAILPYGYSALSANSANWTSVYNTVSSNSASWGASGVDSATVSAIASGYAESAASSKLDSTAFNSGDFYTTANESGYVGSAYVESAVSGKADSSSLSSYALSSDVSGVIDTVSANSASWTTDLTDYATTAYVDSSVSSKLDSSASSTFYTTANESGFVDSAYVDSAVSGKMDTSAMTSYALSADVSGTVDLVSTQSANWGGSALALSAGPGVKLEMSGNTLVASTDETVLWSGSSSSFQDANTGITLLESPFNFEYTKLYWVPWAYSDSANSQEAITMANVSTEHTRIGGITEWNSNGTMFLFAFDGRFDSAKFYANNMKYWVIGDNVINTDMTGSYINKIVGINRTAGV